VSWGTKGDNVIHTELGAAVSAGKGEKGDIVEVEVPTEQLDIDAGYDDALANVRERRPIPPKPVNENTLQEDYYREIRTRLVLIWIVSNATLGMALTEVYSTGLSGTNGYLKCKNPNEFDELLLMVSLVILWAIAGLAAFRFIGSTTYLLVNIVQKIARSKYYRKFSDA
jgi:chitin synthase